MFGLLERALASFDRSLYRSFDPRSMRGRHSKWPALVKRFKAEKRTCVVSGLKTTLEVHHLKPYHLFPELELEWDNLRLIARPFHYLFGHFCNWTDYNPDFDLQVETYREWVAKHRRK